MTSRPPLMTVADFISYLERFENDAELDFSGLDFYRLKQRGDKLVQVEFNQTVCRDGEGVVSIIDHSEAQ